MDSDMYHLREEMFAKTIDYLHLNPDLKMIIGNTTSSRTNHCPYSISGLRLLRLQLLEPLFDPSSDLYDKTCLARYEPYLGYGLEPLLNFLAHPHIVLVNTASDFGIKTKPAGTGVKKTYDIIHSSTIMYAMLIDRNPNSGFHLLEL